MTRRRGRPVLARWRKHVAGVERELRNAAAPPPWWERMWTSLRRDYGLDEPAAPVVPAAPTLRPTGGCDHSDARSTTIGALIRKPRPGDAALLSIPAMHCRRCGLTVAVIR